MHFGKRQLQEDACESSRSGWCRLARNALKKKMGKPILDSLVHAKNLTVRQVLQLNRKIKNGGDADSNER